MPENATVIKEIQSKFTANITDYRKKVEQLSGLVSSMTKNLDAVQRTAASAMKSPSESTQKLGRALDATARKLQGQKEKFDGLTKAGGRTAQQMDQLNQKLTGLSNTYHAIQAAASTIDLSTPIQKQADAAKAAVEQIDIDSGEMLSVDQARARLDQLAQSGVEAAEKLDRLQAAIDSIGTENQGCANKIESLAVALKNAGQDKFVFLSQGMERLESKIDATTTKLGSLGDKLSDMSARAEHLAGSMKETKNSLDQQAGSLSKSSRLFEALKNVMGRMGLAAGGGLSAVRNRIAGIGSSASSSTGRVERLLRSIRRISLVSLALRVVRPIFGELTSSVNRYMEQNKAAAASIERLRNGLANALAPAINVVINLLNQVMPYLIGIADAVASLITNIFGTGWTSVSTGGTTAANNVADSAGNAADKVGDLADSTNDAADAQEKYNKLIAGFDEITKLEEQTSSSGSGSGGGGSGGSGGGGSGGATQTTAPGAEGIAGKLPKWLESLATQLRELFDAQDFTGIGELLATKFGDLVDYLDAKLTDPAFQQKVSNACQHVVDVINGFFETMTYSDDATSSIATRTGNLVGDALTLCLNTLDQFLTGVKWNKIGIAVAQGINGTIEKLTANDVNFGTVIAGLINAGIGALSGFTSTMHWSEVGGFIAGNINSFFETVKWKEVGRTARELIEGLGEMLGTAIRTIDKDKIKQAFTEFMTGAGWVGELALDVALAFGTVKAVGTASKILESLGLIEGGVSGATMTLSVALVIGAKWAIEGFSGLAAMLFGTDEEKEAAREKAENSGIWWTLGSGIAGALNSALDGAVEMAISLKNNVAEMWSNIKQWWSDYVDRVGENLQCFVEVANQAKEWWSNVKQWWSERVGNVAEFWTGVKNNASAWWSNVCDWWSERVGNVAEFWTGVKNNASAWWSNVKQWWSDIVSGKSLSFEAAISLVKDGWETVRGWVADNVGGVFEFLIDLAIPEWLQELLGIDKVDKKVNVSVAGTTNSVYEGLVKSMGGTLSGTVQKTANAVLKGSKGSGFSNITTYNNTKNKSVNLKVGVRKNGATTVSVKPSSGIIGGMVKKILGSTNLFSLRFAARGGIVDSATLFGNTVMGEAGKEAIIPLENHTEWLDKVADRVARRVERNGGEQTINVYVTLDGTIVGKSVVRYVNGVAKSTGVNPLSAYI